MCSGISPEVAVGATHVLNGSPLSGCALPFIHPRSSLAVPQAPFVAAVAVESDAMVVADFLAENPARQVQELRVTNQALQIIVELGGETPWRVFLVFHRQTVNLLQRLAQTGALAASVRIPGNT